MENLVITEASKQAKYEQILPQVKALLSGETNTVANMANMCAVLKETFDFLWVGFYFVDGDELVLGPFQGPIACTRIRKGKGVCGTAWELNKTMIVDDVNEFEGHIACSSASVSEIVLPVVNDRNEVVAVLDIDSVNRADFDAIDEEYLTKMLPLVS